MLITAHINPSQPHQREHYEWLRSGLKRHGLALHITHDKDEEADIHIVSGPHYAKSRWVGHPRTILLDCAYYHPEPAKKWNSMDWVSLGWMNAEGGRDFVEGEGRTPPEIRDQAGTEGSIFLADFDGPTEKADTVRLHPAEQPPTEPLSTVLRRHKTAIGYTTTALVQAGLMGLDIVCKDTRNIMSQSNWRELLPYADWRYNEIQLGETWAHLASSLPQ